MSFHPPTPALTPHARQRCREMGVPTKVAKRIVQNPCQTWPSPGRYGKGEERMAYSTEHPEYAVIYAEEPLRVVTVLYWAPEEAFERPKVMA